ncbi:MAG: WD40 repeat domain-containing protein [Planctomycetota bacterium]
MGRGALLLIVGATLLLALIMVPVVMSTVPAGTQAGPDRLPDGVNDDGTTRRGLSGHDGGAPNDDPTRVNVNNNGARGSDPRGAAVPAANTDPRGNHPPGTNPDNPGGHADPGDPHNPPVDPGMGAQPVNPGDPDAGGRFRQQWQNELTEAQAGDGLPFGARIDLQYGHDHLLQPGFVRRLAVSTAGDRILVQISDRSLRVLTREGFVVRELPDADAPIQWSGFSADGTRVSVLQADGVLRTASATDAAGAWLASFATGRECLCGVAMPDGSAVYTGGSDGSVIAFDPQTGERRGSLPQVSSAILALAISASARHVLSIDATFLVRCFDATTGNSRDVLQLTSKKTPRASAIGERFVIHDGNLARAFDPAIEGTDEALGNLDAIGPAVALGTIGTASARVAAANQHTARVVDAATGALVREFTLTATGNRTAVASFVALAFIDADTLVAAGNDNMLVFLHVDTGEIAASDKNARHSRNLMTIGFATEGTRMATAAYFDRARLWDAASGEPLMTTTQEFSCAALTPDGLRMVAATQIGEVVWIDVASRETVATLTALDSNNAPTRIGVTADSRFVVVSGNHRVSVCDRDGSSVIKALMLEQPIVDLALLPDGGHAALVLDGRIELRHLPDGAVAQSMIVADDPQRIVAASADGRWLVSGGDSGPLRIWNASAGSINSSCTGHTGRINRVAISSDSTRIASIADNGVMRVWSLPDGAPLAAWRPSTVVTVVAFVPGDATRIVAGNSDGTLTRWQLIPVR